MSDEQDGCEWLNVSSLMKIISQVQKFRGLSGNVRTLI